MKTSILLTLGCWLIFGAAYLTQPIDPGLDGKYLRDEQVYRSRAVELAAPEIRNVLPVSNVSGVAIYEDDPYQEVDLSPVDVPTAELRIAAQEVNPHELQLQLFPKGPDPELLQTVNLKPVAPRTKDRKSKTKRKRIAKPRRKVDRRRAKKRRKPRKVASNRKRKRVRKTVRNKPRRVRRNKRKRVRNTEYKTAVATTTRGYAPGLNKALESKR